MMGAADTAEATAGRLDALLAEVERCADPRLRFVAQELVRELMRFYGAALTRVTARLGPETTRRLAADDDLVAGVLALHDLHPDGVTAEALASPPAAAAPPDPDGRPLLPLTPVAPVRPLVAAAGTGGGRP
jgi:hypothetical protein